MTWMQARFLLRMPLPRQTPFNFSFIFGDLNETSSSRFNQRFR